MEMGRKKGNRDTGIKLFARG